MNPKVSIIITIYNREKYIEECARSLFEQTLEDIEYIFIDDASSDNTINLLFKVIKQYPYRESLIKVIQLKKNGGVSNARNIGMRNVTGDYVIHADSDDWVDKNMYKTLYEKAVETGAEIVGCNICHEYQESKSILFQHYAETVQENISRLIKGDIHPSLCTSLTKTSLIRNNNIEFPIGLNMGEDLFFNLQLYLCAQSIIGIDFAPYHYRHTQDSSSFNHTKETINSGIKVGEKIEKLLKKRHRYAEFEMDVAYRKFSLKLSLIKDFDNDENYHYWLKTFPETHQYIWKFKQLDWKLRIELWAAAHHMYPLAQFIKKALDWQYKFKHPSISAKV